MPRAYDSHRTYSLAVSLISKWEGFREDVYFDSVGVRTVGFGFTDSLPFWNEIEAATPLTRDEADRFLIRALEGRYVPALRRFTEGVLDAPHKVAALSSWTYNVGIGAASGSSLTEYLTNGDEEKAEEELLQWVYAGGEVLDGLVARREAERRLMERDEMSQSTPEYMEVDPKKVPVAEVEKHPTEGLPKIDALAERVPQRVLN